MSQRKRKPTPRHTQVITVVSGRCMVCGCTQEQPCDLGYGQYCGWMNCAHTLCTNLKCLRAVGGFPGAARVGR